MNFSIIQKSQLENAKRMDAEYYQPEYLNLIKNLKDLKAVPIREIVINPKRKFSPVRGKKFKYIEISEINLENGEYNVSDILGENAPDRAQWVVKKNDVIISMVRPIRNAVSLIDDNNENLVCSSGFAVLKSQKIDPEYLFVYLKSRPIAKLLDRLTTATMYPAVNINDILNTKIYLGSENFRNEIKDEVIKARKKIKISKQLYQQAENLLLEELGLKGFEEDQSLFSIVNLSDVKNAHRMDAEYFQEKYKKILETVSKKFAVKNLKEIFDFKRGIFISANYYTNKKTDTPYIRIKELAEKGGINKSEIIYVNKKYSGNKKDKIKKDDLVIAVIGDTIGKTNKIDQELGGGYCSNNTGRLRLKENFKKGMLPEFNEILFQSVFIQSQIEQKKAQAGQPKINDAEIKSIKIPILPKETQQKIAELVQKSHKSRKEAKELLEKAKRKVEEIIEKNNS